MYTFRNILMEFNLQDKIQFKDLNPSLQMMILNNASTTITTLNKTIETLNSKIAELENKVESLETIIESNNGGGGSAGFYVLPKATSSTLGGIKAGKGLSVSEDGILSITGAENADTYDIAEDDIMDEILNDMSRSG